MTEEIRVPVSQELKRHAHIDAEKYESLYTESIQNPEAFWEKQASRLTWFKKWSEVKRTTFDGDVSIRWFDGGKLNVSYNCIDRHLETSADRIAFIWEPDSPDLSAKKISYQELHDEVCRLSHALKSHGVQRGDRVTLYLPMVPEAVYAMLACTRIGAIHSVVFGGFSAEALAGRIQDCDSRFIITADEGIRGGKKIALKAEVDQALRSCPEVRKVLTLKNTGAEISWNSERDIWYHEAVEGQPTTFPPEEMDAEDPLFILYTSGSTGKPKGVLHTTGGYLTYASLTHEWVFDYKKEDIYWCTADIGWVTGHSYVVYGPLSNGATSVLFEGVPHYPDCSRHWEIVDKHQVSIYYTAPTAIRALMGEGNEPVEKTSRRSLRILGTVGEPINPEAWRWYYETVGDKRCPVVDTWWQTETGGILITPLPGATELKPGSATRPFFGIQPELVDDEGKPILGAGSGNLCLKDSWPGQMRTVYKDHARFVETYFKTFPGKYFTGDGCRRDEDGYYWITGRVDDVLNISGHRLGTAEVESALVAHPSVSEAAVVGCPHDIKGQGIYAYVTLQKGTPSSDELRNELIQWVRKEIGPIATPDAIQWAPGLPKTRSGKIMRRILRKIAENQPEALGDISTLADTSVVDSLIKNRVKGAHF